MDLTSDHPFWWVKNGLIESYPALDRDIFCDVVVVGAGVTGAMIGSRLTDIGLHVVVVDRRDVCLGSTSASTALLQYEIDVSLVEMSIMIGRRSAERAYQLSYAAIDLLEEFAACLPTHCGFERKTSLYLARDPGKVESLVEEARARRLCGIDVRLLNSQEIREEFQLTAAAALVSQQAAVCDPYQLAHGLLADSRQRGAEVFDRTAITRFEHNSGKVRLHTDRGPVITTSHVVMASGYESQSLLDEQIVELKSTYAIVSQPLESFTPWNSQWIMWEAEDPYLYLRTTADNRLLMGGEDDSFRNPTLRDGSLGMKAQRIREKVQQLLPDLNWETEFAWAGTFGETRDGLAYIGPTAEFPNFYFALAFGGNGMVFSAIAADLLADLLMGVPNPDAELFRFRR